MDSKHGYLTDQQCTCGRMFEKRVHLSQHVYRAEFMKNNRPIEMLAGHLAPR